MRLDTVERVVRAAAVTPLPKAPEIVLGILDFQGRVIPVFNMRRRFGLVEREILPQDQFVIARAGERSVALVVDGTESVLSDGEWQNAPAPDFPLPAEYLAGVTRSASGLVLIHDLETFLSADEAHALTAALKQHEV